MVIKTKELARDLLRYSVIEGDIKRNVRRPVVIQQNQVVLKNQ